MKTFQAKTKDVIRNWHLVDAKGKVLGRLATEVAKLLMGKHKVTYTPHMDMGDYVVVINAREVELTGKKEKQKVYRRHSGYPGGFKEVKYEKLIKEQPHKVVEFAISRMLPKNRLQSKRLKRLKIYADVNHEYQDKFKERKEDKR